MASIPILLLSLNFISVLGVLNPVDFLALQAIRKSLYDLPGSRFFAAWDFTADPCAFPGVTCHNGRVSMLALGDSGAGPSRLAGHLDSTALSLLTALSELSLVPGRVSGPIPATLPHSLRFLALPRNLFSGSIPSSLSSLPFLQTLDLSSNLLSGPIPQTLPQIRTLSYLSLRHNRLTGPIPSFPSGSSLLRLDLKRNSLSGPIPPLPSSLRYLSLSNNLLSGRIDKVLPRLTRLNYLDLSSNRLAGPIPGRIFSFPISSLQLQRNFFSGPVRMAAGFAGTPVVDLSHNHLTGRIPAALAGAEVLYLNDNKLTGVLPAEFLKAMIEGRIRVLYLQRNYLTGMQGMGPINGVPDNTTLCLKYNCMLPPAGAKCPNRGGAMKTRPKDQCARLRE
ncbi:DNA damage-repair/toleration protein DRT100-like [Dioscorea cayenensis subsp. rotundata]|uniref:DNA damage-repair/toleration protein DRT100-like n=1 Tax=Dioscorea cayennensis subsp. rotundata TaxID=55577 RepID=A0AB40D7L9_DIOCR|nr:DNA damage-repair/toleration protein DRT100-like [Dioscorea cayenensis subsp. rotundata]